MVPMRDGTIAQLRRGVIEFCVLALLRDGERYGFELVRTLSEADGMVTTEGTLYPLLGRLRREGLVETTWRESPSGPPRRYYRLTADGETALGAFREEWARFSGSVDHLLATQEETARRPERCIRWPATPGGGCAGPPSRSRARPAGTCWPTS